jgi:DNA-binding IclR family transcriptional regulator
MSSDQPQKLVPAVQNAAKVIRLLSAKGTALGATQIARECDLNVSSVFNILRTLHHEGWLSFDEATKSYRLGMGLLTFAAPLLAASPADLVRPVVADIAERHQVMIALWHITDSERIVLIDTITADRIVQAVIARDSRLPVFAGAIGRCYAAALNLDRDTARAGFDTVRWQTDPGFDAYWSDIQSAHDSRIGFDHGNLFRGLEIVAVIALDRNGTPRMGMSSITIAGQHTMQDLERVGDDLSRAALQIEGSLFGRHTLLSGKENA